MMSQAKNLINSLLVDVFNHILSIEAQTLKKRGVELSMNEIHVLEAIKLVENATMGNVAKKLRVALGTLTTAIDVLVKKGYVKRKRDKDDRRRVLLALTEKSEDVLKIHTDFHNEMIDSIFTDLSIQEDDVLLKSLENIHTYFKEKY